MSRMTVSDIVSNARKLVTWMDGSFQVLVSVDSVETRAVTNFPDDDAHFFTNLGDARKSVEDVDYPKCVIVIDGGQVKRQPSLQAIESVNIDFVFLFKQTDPNSEIKVSELIGNVIDDFRLSTFQNNSFFGKAESLDLLFYTTDSGITDPEGILFCKVNITYRYGI